MLSIEKILKQAGVELKNHSVELKALRKVKKGKARRSLSVTSPHFTALLSSGLQKKKVSVKDKGVRVILLEGNSAVGTMDLALVKRRLKFSHFTFGKKTRLFYKQLKHIYKKYKISDDTLLEVIKVTALGKSFIRFSFGDVLLYFDADQDTDVSTMEEKAFIKTNNLEVKKLLAAERKFQEKKTKTKSSKIDQLRYLNYL